MLALRHADGVTIGSDSMVTGSGFKWTEDAPKYFVHGDAVIGYCGDTRLCQVTEAMPALRRPRAGEKPINYVAHVIAEAIRQTHRAHDRESSTFEALIVWRGAVYELGDGYGVTCPDRGYVAVGSGSGAALGAVACALRVAPQLSPREIVTAAIEASAEHMDSVGGPIHVLDIRSRRKR